MSELAKAFIGKECLIYTMNDQIRGTVTEVNDNAILVQRSDSVELVNLAFVLRIREYPTKKNGKKKDIVLD